MNEQIPRYTAQRLSCAEQPCNEKVGVMACDAEKNALYPLCLGHFYAWQKKHGLKFDEKTGYYAGSEKIERPIPKGGE